MNDEDWIAQLDQKDDPGYAARKRVEDARKRRAIIDEVTRAAGPDDDIDFLTKRELYKARLISAGELHATGSRELLPRGWYEYYVPVLDTFCPARVFSVEEAGADAAALYEQGFRWMVVFSKATGPRGDRTFIDVQSHGAIGMTLGGQWEESTALAGIELMLGFQIADLPGDVFIMQRPGTPAPAAPQPTTVVPPPGWYPDPIRRFEWRWWDGQRWTPTVAVNSRTYSDPV